MDQAIGTIVAVIVLVAVRRHWRRTHPDAGDEESRHRDMRVAAIVAIVGFGIVGVAVVLDLLTR